MARYVLGERAANAVRRLMGGDGKTSRRDVIEPGIVTDLDFADPFTVTYAASLAGTGGGQGGEFIIWLPSGELVTVNGIAYDVTDGRTAAGGDYPAGWYKLPVSGLSSGGDVYLIVKPGDQTPVKFDSEPDDTAPFNVKVAEVAVDSITGAIFVKQMLTSAIVLGSAESPSPFMYKRTTTESGGTVTVSHTVEYCKFFCNGTLVTLADYDVSSLMNGGTLYLRGVRAAATEQAPDPAWGWTLGSSPATAPSGGEVRNFVLYEFADGSVARDWRGIFLALEFGGVGGGGDFDRTKLGISHSLSVSRHSEGSGTYSRNLVSYVALTWNGVKFADAEASANLTLAMQNMWSQDNVSGLPDALTLTPGSGIRILKNGSPVQSTSGGGTFAIEAVYV